VPQEEENHHHYQSDRQHQFKLNVFDRSANGLGSVDQDLDFDGCGQRRLELRKGFLDAVRHSDNIGARLALNVQQHSGRRIDPRGLLNVFSAVDCGSDVSQTHWSAVAVSDDDVVVIVARKQLIVRANRERLAGTVNYTFGL